MAQFLRPTSNITQTAFTGGFAEIDETTASDADRAWSTDGSDAELEVGLSSATDPNLNTGHIIRYRVAKTDDGALSNTGNAKTVIVRLLQGTTVIGTDTERTLTGTYTTYTWTLTGTQADAITNYGDLRLEFVTLGGGGNPSNRRGMGVSWAEMEIPNAGAQLSRTAADTISIGTSTASRVFTAVRTVSDTGFSGGLPTQIAVDNFDDVVVSSWGDADIGGSWSYSDPSHAFSKTGSYGQFSFTGPSAYRAVLVDGPTAIEQDVTAEFSNSVITSYMAHYMLGRITTTGDATHRVESGYAAVLHFENNGSVGLSLAKFISGGENSLDTDPGYVQVAGVDSLFSGAWWNVRLQVEGTTIRARAWANGSSEPSTWQVVGSDNDYSAAGGVGINFYNGGGAVRSARMRNLVATDLSGGGGISDLIDAIVTVGGAVLRTAGDTITTVTDGVSRIANKVRSSGDTITTVTDNLARSAASKARSVGDTITSISDSVSRVANKLRVAGDTITTVTDTVVRSAMNKVRTAVDTITTVTDSVLGARFFGRFASDTITTISDAVTRTFKRVRSLADTVVTSDSVSRMLSLMRATADTTSVSDTVTRVFVRVRSIVDTVSVNDAIARIVTFGRVATDTISSATDSIVRSAMSKVRTTADAITTSDAVSRLVSAFKSASDTITTSDSVFAQLIFGAQEYFRTATDSIVTSDVVARVLVLARSATDTTTYSDAATRAYGAVRGAVDTIATSDLVSRFMSGVRSITDTTSVTDIVTRGSLALTRLASDATASVSDAVIRVSNKIRSASDATGLSESVSRSWQGARSAIDTLPAIVDTVVTGLSVILYRVASDTVSIGSDAVSRVGTFGRSIADSIITSDAINRIVTLTRSAIDSVVIQLDIVVRSGVTVLRGVSDTVFTSDIVSYIRGLPLYTGEVVRNIGGLIYMRIGKNSRRRDNVNAGSNSMNVESGPRKFKVK